MKGMRPARWTTLVLMMAGGWVTVVGVRHLLRAKAVALPAVAMAGEPQTMLWAWETPEDLRALDPQRAGVAYLSREIDVGSTVTVSPRRQPLQVADGTWMMAVVRLDAAGRVDASAEMRERVVAAILPAMQQANVRGLQIDFDATASQLPFYVGVLRELRRRMPAGMPLSITALTSWCGPQSWLASIEGDVDEAVPMFFRMGGTPALRRATPKSASGITQRLCGSSVGVATDEPWPPIHSMQRVYIFRAGPWSAEEVRRLNGKGRRKQEGGKSKE